MSQSSVKYKRIFSLVGDVSIPDRVVYLENNEYKILYFQTINSTTGTITPPPQATILLDQFYEGGDAIVETLNNSQPTGQSPLTIGGAVVSVTSFNTAGNYVLSGTPVSFPVALVYILKIKGKDYQNLNVDNIMSMTTTETAPEVEWLSFDTTPVTVPDSEAVMSWNDSLGTVDLQLKGSTVVANLGQNLVARVVNKATIDLLRVNYQVVKITGATGQRLSADLAQGNNDPNSVDTLGIVSEDILKNQEGFITTFGLLDDINTTGSLQGETWLDGDPLYLSPTVAGGITKIKPSAPDHMVSLGYVEYAHANHGKIFVKIQNGYELDELHNVYAPTPVNGDTIAWNSTNNRYENKQITGYVLTLGATNTNPVDATTYYIGGTYAVAMQTGVATINRVYIPKTGTIKAANVSWQTSAGSNTLSSVYVRVNNTTDYLISSSVNLSTNQAENSNYSMNIPVVQGDYIMIKWDTPTWPSNPTTTRVHVNVYIE